MPSFDIGITDIVDTILQSATDHLVVFLPLFSVIIGLLLAALVIMHIIDMVREEKNMPVDSRDDML